MTEIVLLAMVAVFLGFRLYGVLGKRTGHEQQPAPKPVERPADRGAFPRAVSDAPVPATAAPDSAVTAGATDGVRAIAAAEPGFDPIQFLAGAQAAYRMVLEAFWRGDEEELGRLAEDDVRDAFGQAIADRNAAGHVLDNRLLAIEHAVIERARLDGKVAFITVRFDADIAGVTRNAEGEVVAGSLSDAVETHDVWTFSRKLRTDDPNWILVETDEAA